MFPALWGQERHPQAPEPCVLHPAVFEHSTRGTRSGGAGAPTISPGASLPHLCGLEGSTRPVKTQVCLSQSAPPFAGVDVSGNESLCLQELDVQFCPRHVG